jgi:tetratricopeptide (TPR) repeat protein
LINDTDGEALYIKGDCQLKEENFKEAKETFEKACSMKEYQLDSYYKVGLIYEKLDQPNDAIKSYKKALTKQIDHKDSLLALSNIFMRLHQYDRAIKYFRHALEYENDDDIEILYGYSLAVFRSYVNYND